MSATLLRCRRFNATKWKNAVQIKESLTPESGLCPAKKKGPSALPKLSHAASFLPGRTVRSGPAQTSEPFVVFLGGVAAFGPGGAGPEFAPHKKARSSLPRFPCVSAVMQVTGSRGIAKVGRGYW